MEKAKEIAAKVSKTKDFGERSKLELEVEAIVIEAVEASRDTALGGIPAGHLYAALMGVMTLEQFQIMMKNICNSGKVGRNRGEQIVNGVCATWRFVQDATRFVQDASVRHSVAVRNKP